MNVANGFTTLRILIAPFTYYAGFTAEQPLFFALFALGGITDFLDGFLARTLKLKSKFGSKLDTIADVIFYPAALTVVFFAPQVRSEWEFLALASALMGTVILITYMKGKLSMPHQHTAKAAAVAVYLFALVTAGFGYYPALLYVTIAIICIAAIDKLRLVLAR